MVIFIKRPREAVVTAMQVIDMQAAQAEERQLQLCQEKKRKADYCKNFNKGLVCRYGKKCRFTERCSHCNSADHPLIKCPQLFNKLDDSK